MSKLNEKIDRLFEEVDDLKIEKQLVKAMLACLKKRLSDFKISFDGFNGVIIQKDKYKSEVEVDYQGGLIIRFDAEDDKFRKSWHSQKSRISSDCIKVANLIQQDYRVYSKTREKMSKSAPPKEIKSKGKIRLPVYNSNKKNNSLQAVDLVRDIRERVGVKVYDIEIFYNPKKNAGEISIFVAPGRKVGFVNVLKANPYSKELINKYNIDLKKSSMASSGFQGHDYTYGDAS